MQQTANLRNVAIIAHVDHGKTTLVDGLFRQAGLFRENQEVANRIMDNMDLERERGITIAAKNCSVMRGEIKINIIDTPGHADFGGEVERSLSMADGAILLVDAAEGPLPQTRFVLGKALGRGLPIIVVINKIDRSDARPGEVLDEIYDLFIDLDASEEQLEFPLLYAIGRDGVASRELETPGENLDPIFDAIINQLPAPKADPDGPFKMLVADLSYSDYLGRLAVGRVASGRVKESDQLVRIGENGEPAALRVTRLQGYEGPRLAPTDSAVAGDIVVLSGIERVKIGDTICTTEDTTPLPRIRVDEPTVSMKFSINTSPLAGTEGTIVQSAKIRERLQRETLTNVAMRVEDTDEKDSFLVKGRGEFQMAILVEQMRREGFELTVGRP
ncbi:MAG: GTP-binding protein, partial [Desulfovibrionaceae bacterium]